MKSNDISEIVTRHCKAFFGSGWDDAEDFVEFRRELIKELKASDNTNYAKKMGDE